MSYLTLFLLVTIALSAPLVVPLSAAAQILSQTATMEVIPPDPTSNEDVTLKLCGNWRDSCVPKDPHVSITGNTIDITTAGAGPGGACPRVCSQVITPWCMEPHIGRLAADTYDVAMTYQLCGVSEPVALVPDSFDVLPGCIRPPAGLVSWWPGDGTAEDLENGSMGTLQGGATFIGGQVEQAFLLNGIAAAVGAGNASNLHVSAGDFSVDAWVNFNALRHPPGFNAGAPAGDMSIVDKMSANGGVNSDGWRLLKHDDDHFWFCLGGGQTNGCVLGGPLTVRSATAATTGVWYHVAAVKSATSIAIYVNGALEDSKPLAPFRDSNSTDLLIGANLRERARLNGMVDEVEVFSRALSQGEIAAIVNAGSEGKCKNLPPAARVWVGLKNSDDQGTQFDIKVELFHNDTLVAEGLQRCVGGVTRNPSRAKQVKVVWDGSTPVALASGDVLAFRVSARIGTTATGSKCSGPGGSHSNARGLRLYYDSAREPSRFSATIAPDPGEPLYLRSDGLACRDTERPGVTLLSLDTTAPTATRAKCTDSGGVNFAGGNPFAVIGTWSLAPLP